MSSIEPHDSECLLDVLCVPGLIVLTTMAGYAVAHAPFCILPFAAVSIGTGLTSAAANSINQVPQ